MQHSQGYYPLGNSGLHYLIFGKGKKLLIAFHGFGDDASLFRILEPSLGEYFTMISVDLPFHGLTKWEEKKILTQKDLTSFAEAMMREHMCENISVAGFSLGGKPAFSLFAAIPAKVEFLWLFSPEGIKKNIWYSMAVYTKWGRMVFRRVMNNPRLFLKIADILGYIHLLPASVNKFLHTQLQLPEKRRLAWNAWMSIRGLEIPAMRLKGLLKKYNTKTYCFFGKYDGIITADEGEKFAAGLSDTEVIILEKGHYLLKDYLNPYISQRLA